MAYFFLFLSIYWRFDIFSRAVIITTFFHSYVCKYEKKSLEIHVSLFEMIQFDVNFNGPYDERGQLKYNKLYLAI